MDRSKDEEFMKVALEEASLAFLEGEVPVGAVIVKDGIIIARGHNHKESKKDVTSHAEIEAIKAAEKSLNNLDLSSCELFVTLEPCLMCGGAIIQSRISRLVYGCDDVEEGAISSLFHIFDDLKRHPILIKRGLFSLESSELLRKFFQIQRKGK